MNTTKVKKTHYANVTILRIQQESYPTIHFLKNSHDKGTQSRTFARSQMQGLMHGGDIHCEKRGVLHWHPDRPQIPHSPICWFS